MKTIFIVFSLVLEQKQLAKEDALKPGLLPAMVTALTIPPTSADTTWPCAHHFYGHATVEQY